MGQGVTPWGRGQQWGLIQVGGAGVKAINTLILSSFLCCPKQLMAPKASLGTAHGGWEVWDLGHLHPGGSHHPGGPRAVVPHRVQGVTGVWGQWQWWEEARLGCLGRGWGRDHGFGPHGVPINSGIRP